MQKELDEDQMEKIADAESRAAEAAVKAFEVELKGQRLPPHVERGAKAFLVATSPLEQSDPFTQGVLLPFTRREQHVIRKAALKVRLAELEAAEPHLVEVDNIVEDIVDGE